MSLLAKIRRAFEPSFPKVVFTLALALSFTMVRFRYEAKQVKKSPPKLLTSVATLPTPVSQVPAVVPSPEKLPDPFAALEKIGQFEKKQESLVILSKLGAAPSQPPLKKIAHRRILKKVTKQAPQKKGAISKLAAQHPEPSEDWYEARWNETWDLIDAVDTSSPLDSVVAKAFDEPSLIEDVQFDPMLIAIHLGIQTPEEEALGREQRLHVTEGEIAQNDFSDIKESFAAFNDVPEIQEKIVAPKTIATEVAVVNTQNTRRVLDASQELEGKGSAHSEVMPAHARDELQEDSGRPETESSSLQASLESPQANSISERAIERSGETPPTRKIDPRSLAPLQAGVSIASLTTQNSAPIIPQVITQGKAESHDGSAKAESGLDILDGTDRVGVVHDGGNQEIEKSPVGDPELVAPRDSGIIHGKLYWDAAVESWLTQNKAHIELRLERYKSRNPQDTIFLTEYKFPHRDFQVNAKALRGNYQLIAALYTPKETGKVAQVTYSKLISAENYKENIFFKITFRELERALAKPAQWTSQNITLTATVFEGASGNPRQPKVIPGAAVTVIGHPEIGTIRANVEGNIRIPNVPAKSELVLEVHQLGYYSARYVVPVFESNVYTPIYLMEKDKVDAITKYFTKRDQATSKGLVFGRIFDSETRSPKKEEQIWLSFRKSHPLYFDALPNTRLKETTDTGMFAFFNIEPSFRTLLRDKKPGFLMSVRPSFAQYVEIGRGGAKTFIGRLFDPFSNTGVPGKVRFVGGDGLEAIADESGNFEFANIDLPPGVLTIEIQAEGYPTTWHTVPWNIRETQKRHSLFLLEKGLISESQKRVARVRHEKGTGLVVGGADPSFFGKKNGCIAVELEDTDNKAVASVKGPFALSGTEETGNLCLTAQRPGFAFYNLPSGEYILKWKNAKGLTLRSHLVRVGMDRVSVVVN